jgi:outer membrane protein OmpA-like peptidoglycan-associated protein
VIRRSVLFTTVGVLLAVGPACAGGAPGAAAPDAAPAVELAAPDPAPAPSDATTGGSVGPGVASAAGRNADPACAPGPGKKVTMLPDVVIPAVDEPEVRVEDVVVGGRTVRGFVVPAVHLPEQTLSPGCTIEHEAPGGCLGTTEISRGSLPAVELRGYEIPPANVDTPFPGEKVEGDRVEGQDVDAERAEQVCQTVLNGTTLLSVTRPLVLRAGLLRSPASRNGAYRPRLCVGGECTDPVTVPAVFVQSVSVPSATVPQAKLEGRPFGSSLARVLKNESQTAYVTPADVLFDFDKATLKPGAIPTLQAIAADIRDKGGDQQVKVEGHTDGLGEHAYNQRLSDERARAVVAWLTSDGSLVSGRLTTVGLAETAPAAPNKNPDGSDNPEGRALNRRVVISLGAG